MLTVRDIGRQIYTRGMGAILRCHSLAPRGAYLYSEWITWLILAATTIVRFTVGSSRPLWMDENWTAMIATQPTLSDFVRQCFYDTNAPLYYLVAFLTAKLIGVSDFALRLPATVFGVLAPGAAMLVRIPASRRVHLTWTILIACWVPGLWFSQDARCYTLLLLFAVINNGWFCEMFEEPSARTFGRWAIVSSLMVLTHYYAGLLISVQLLALLLLRRASIRVFWPGLLAFVPAVAALGVSASKFLLFADPNVSWIHLVDSDNIYWLISRTLGSPALPIFLLVWIWICLLVSAIASAGQKRIPLNARQIAAVPSIWIAAGASIACIAIALAVGAIRPVLYEKYLTSFVPGAMLMLSLMADGFVPAIFAHWALRFMFVVVCAVWALTASVGVNVLNIETASRWLMQYNPQRLVYLWDSPFMLALSRSSGNHSALEGMGRFFFARSGRPIPVDAVDVRPGVDPNPVLAQQASAPGSVIIWVYDFYVAGTNALKFPPRLDAFDPSWVCRDFGHGGIHVLGCYKAGVFHTGTE